MSQELRQVGVFLASGKVLGADEAQEKQRVAAVRVAAESLCAAGCTIVMCEDSADIGVVMRMAESYAGQDSGVVAVRRKGNISRAKEEELKIHARFGNLTRMGRLNMKEVIDKTNLAAMVIVGGEGEVKEIKNALKTEKNDLGLIVFASTGGEAARTAGEKNTVVADAQYTEILVALAGLRVVEAVNRIKQEADLAIDKMAGDKVSGAKTASVKERPQEALRAR